MRELTLPADHNPPEGDMQGGILINLFTPRSKKIIKNIGFWVPGPIQMNRYLKDMSIRDKNVKNGCASAEKQTKMFFGTKTVCVADTDFLCCRQEDAFLGETISALWKDNILILQDYNLELEDIIHDLCGLVGGAMDLTTRAPGFDSPLPPKPVATLWHSLRVFSPTKIDFFHRFS